MDGPKQEINSTATAAAAAHARDVYDLKTVVIATLLALIVGAGGSFLTVSVLQPWVGGIEANQATIRQQKETHITDMRELKESIRELTAQVKVLNENLARMEGFNRGRNNNQP